MASKQRGTPSNRRLGDTVRARVIELIGAHYRDFGPTLASETLAERHGLHLSVESIRQIMIQAGYRRAKKGGTVRTHPLRERRARCGELIQIDGSPHDWFEGRGDYCAYSTAFCHPFQRDSATCSMSILPGQPERSDARF